MASDAAGPARRDGAAVHAERAYRLGCRATERLRVRALVSEILCKLPAGAAALAAASRCTQHFSSIYTGFEVRNACPTRIRANACVADRSLCRSDLAAGRGELLYKWVQGRSRGSLDMHRHVDGLCTRSRSAHAIPATKQRTSHATGTAARGIDLRRETHLRDGVLQGLG